MLPPSGTREGETERLWGLQYGCYCESKFILSSVERLRSSSTQRPNLPRLSPLLFSFVLFLHPLLTRTNLTIISSTKSPRQKDAWVRVQHLCLHTGMSEQESSLLKRQCLTQTVRVTLLASKQPPESSDYRQQHYGFHQQQQSASWAWSDAVRWESKSHLHFYSIPFHNWDVTKCFQDGKWHRFVDQCTCCSDQPNSRRARNLS